MMMSRLIAEGIIGSYSMRQRRIADAAVKPPNGIVSNYDVCGGLMLNARERCLFFLMNVNFISTGTSTDAGSPVGPTLGRPNWTTYFNCCIRKFISSFIIPWLIISNAF